MRFLWQAVRQYRWPFQPGRMGINSSSHRQVSWKEMRILLVVVYGVYI